MVPGPRAEGLPGSQAWGSWDCAQEVNARLEMWSYSHVQCEYQYPGTKRLHRARRTGWLAAVSWQTGGNLTLFPQEQQVSTHTLSV